MKVYRDVKQGSREWLELRAGIPTASEFSSILTRKGVPSKSAPRYMYTLLAERCLGEPLTESVTFWMQRGSTMEKEALDYYKFQRDAVNTEAIGFVTNEAGTIGASPDQFVADDGLLEIKCPSPWQHMAWLLQDGTVADDYFIQCQGQLYVTERRWADVMSYCPGLPEALIRVERDEPFIEKLDKAVTAFSNQLEAVYQRIIDEKLIRPKEPEPDHSNIGVIDSMRAAMMQYNTERGELGR